MIHCKNNYSIVVLKNGSVYEFGLKTYVNKKNTKSIYTLPINIGNIATPLTSIASRWSSYIGLIDVVAVNDVGSIIYLSGERKKNVELIYSNSNIDKIIYIIKKKSESHNVLLKFIKRGLRICRKNNLSTKLYCLLTVKINQISCGHSHCIIIADDLNSNKIYSWGDNSRGQLGLGYSNFVRYENPMQVSFFDNYKIKKIVCGRFHTITLSHFGTIYVWGGNNTYGQLGSDVCFDELVDYPIILNMDNEICGVVIILILHWISMVYIYHGELIYMANYALLQ